VQVRPAGFASFVDEASFRNELSLSDGPHRSLESSSYEGIMAWGSLFGYQEAGVDLAASPAYLKSQYASVQGDSYPDDMYAFETAAKRAKHLINPADMQSRSDNAKYKSGIYVPQGSILPLGDNRDNSRDGRYFGPVNQKKINGSVRFRFWPITSMRYLGDA
jgi:signal peptidase I